MQKELVSVIIPVYNCEKMLSKCLDSIINQVFKNLEIIIVNDGSVDNSMAIIMQYQLMDKRIKVINQENKGVSIARNQGIGTAKGKYIAFVDADDYIAKNYIEELYNTICKYDADICICDATMENELSKYNFYNIIDNTSANEICFSLNYGYSYQKYRMDAIWGVLFRSETIKELRFSADLSVGEDSLYFAYAAMRSNKIVYLDKKLYHYVVYENSACHGIFNEKKYTEVYAWDKICQLFKNRLNVYYSAKCTQALKCRKIILDYYDNELFKKKYYRKTKNIYVKNLKYLLKSTDISFKKKLIGIGFVISPKLYMNIRKIIQNN